MSTNELFRPVTRSSRGTSSAVMSVMGKTVIVPDVDCGREMREGSL